MCVAIEELKLATTVQPENAEAWANPALVRTCGHFGDAVAAGERALSLTPSTMST
jgi:hypothetical protein